MRNICAFILSITVFTQALGINTKSLLKFDDMWSHYQMHQEEYGDDFLTFVDLHYGSSKSEHQDAHDEHQDLPVTDFSHLQTQIVFLSIENFDFEPVEIFIDKSLNTFYTDNYFSTLITEVFQPPKHFDWS